MLRSFGLAVTVFGCGWVLMGLEIVGGRMLSPYFGSGVWVWGSVISVFLLALAVGYFLGGLMSERCPTGLGLALVIGAAALAILPVAVWHQDVSDFFAACEVHERWGSLMAAMTLFFLPSMLLGMVSPYAVRLMSHQNMKVGFTAGTLYAISTVGSFVGCLHTAFYLILWTGIRAILYLSAGILGLVALWVVAMWSLPGCFSKEPPA